MCLTLHLCDWSFRFLLNSSAGSKQASLLPCWISTWVCWNERTSYSPKHFQEDSMQAFKLQTFIVNLIQLHATQPANFHPLKLWVQQLGFKKSRQSKKQFCFDIKNKDKYKPYSSKQKLSSTKTCLGGWCLDTAMYQALYQQPSVKFTACFALIETFVWPAGLWLIFLARTCA